jgi:hypothetical protein
MYNTYRKLEYPSHCRKLDVYYIRILTYIADITGLSERTVYRTIADFSQNGNIAEMAKFRDFEQENSVLHLRQIAYTHKTKNT